MLDLLDDGLEAFLRATVPLSAVDIDVSFEAPDSEYAAKLTRPTVNVFLWDIRRSASRARTGMRTVREDGVTQHQMARPVIELRYVITAWTSDHGDERALLSGLVRTLLANQTIPEEFLAPAFDDLKPPTLLMARAGEDHMDVFKALEGKVKPGLNVVVTTEYDTGTVIPTGPPVVGIDTSIGRIGGGMGDTRRRVAGQIVRAEELAAEGAVVRSPTHASTVNSAGQFLVRARPGDEVVVETTPPLVATVPESGGLVFE